mgnify:CR=1 FL=1
MFGLPDETILAKYVIKTHYIMKVIAFHPENQTVDLIQQTYEFCNDQESDKTVINELGLEVSVGLLKPDILYGIPVKQDRWGQFEIQCCPQPGDTGYIEIFTQDISTWIKDGKLSIPSTDRHFAKESCVFVPFIPNQKNCSETYPEDGSKLIIRSKNAKVEITDKQEEGEDPVIDINTTAKTVHINAEDGIFVEGDITVTGKITATGNIESTEGDVIASGVSLLNHTHTIPTGGIVTEGSATSQTTVAPVVVPKPDEGE